MTTGASPALADLAQALRELEAYISIRNQQVEQLTAERDAPRWTCFHCAETFTTADTAREHFGSHESMEPACRVTGDVAELRRLQNDNASLRADLEYETSSTQAYNAHLLSDLRSYAPFRGCRSVYDAFCVYDSKEGEAIAAKERAEKAEQERDALLLDARPFPMLGGAPPITWGIAKVIYAGYAAMHGRSQTLERMAERGGFGWDEVQFMHKDARFKAAVRKALHSGDESVTPSIGAEG